MFVLMPLPPVSVLDDHYTTYAFCWNCDKKQTLLAEKGTLFEKAVRGLECSNCGCPDQVRKVPRGGSAAVAE